MKQGEAVASELTTYRVHILDTRREITTLAEAMSGAKWDVTACKEDLFQHMRWFVIYLLRMSRSWSGYRARKSKGGKGSLGRIWGQRLRAIYRSGGDSWGGGKTWIFDCPWLGWRWQLRGVFSKPFFLFTSCCFICFLSQVTDSKKIRFPFLLNHERNFHYASSSCCFPSLFCLFIFLLILRASGIGPIVSSYRTHRGPQG